MHKNTIYLYTELCTGADPLIIVLTPCINALPTNDAPMRHDLSELSISLWEFIWGF